MYNVDNLFKQRGKSIGRWTEWPFLSMYYMYYILHININIMHNSIYTLINNDETRMWLIMPLIEIDAVTNAVWNSEN